MKTKVSKKRVIAELAKLGLKGTKFKIKDIKKAIASFKAKANLEDLIPGTMMKNEKGDVCEIIKTMEGDEGDIKVVIMRNKKHRETLNESQFNDERWEIAVDPTKGLSRLDNLMIEHLFDESKNDPDKLNVVLENYLIKDKNWVDRIMKLMDASSLVDLSAKITKYMRDKRESLAPTTANAKGQALARDVGPETWKKQHPNQKMDVFSFNVVLKDKDGRHLCTTPVDFDVKNSTVWFFDDFYKGIKNQKGLEDNEIFFEHAGKYFLIEEVKKTDDSNYYLYAKVTNYK